MTAKDCTLTHEKIKSIFHYDKITGILTRRLAIVKTKKDSVVGYRYNNTSGGKPYIKTKINYNSYLVHRIIWFYMTSEWPDQIDHIDGNGLNNKWDNLREVTGFENHKNVKLFITNTSGVCGVCRHLLANKWQTSIYVNGNSIFLGLYFDWFDAVCARKSAENKYNFHPNHGSIRNL